MKTQTLMQQLEGFEKDMDWLNSRYEELKSKYPDEFVAVLRENIVDHDRDLSKLMGRLETRFPEDFPRIAIKFVSTKRVELIL